MTDARSKLLTRIFLGIAVLLAALVLLYTVALLRPTGYGVVREEAEREVRERAPLKEQARRISVPRREQLAPLETDQWKTSTSLYRALAKIEGFHHAFALHPDSDVHYRSNLHWELFPASFPADFFQWEAADLGNLNQWAKGEQIIHSDDPLPFQYELIMLEWRFVHATLLGNEEEAMAALGVWYDFLTSFPSWMQNRLLNIVTPAVDRLLARLAALGEAAPPAAFRVLDSLLLEQLELLRPEARAREIDRLFQAEYQLALESGYGHGTLALMLGGAIPKAQKGVLLPLLRKEMEAMAVAMMHKDVDGFLAARGRFLEMKDRFPGHWQSRGLYGFRRDTTEEEKSQVAGILNHWPHDHEEREKLHFYRDIVRILEHRHQYSEWPHQGEWNDGTEGEYQTLVIHTEPRTTLLSSPMPQVINLALNQAWEATGRLPENLEEILPFLSEEQLPAVRARFIEVAPRHVYHRPYMHAGHIFIPTSFSEEFRRFMRGEDVSP